MTLGSPILFTKVRILFGFRCYGLNYNFMVNFDDHSFKIIWEIRIHFYKPSFFFFNRSHVEERFGSHPYNLVA
jgi:hypothetical protein